MNRRDWIEAICVAIGTGLCIWALLALAGCSSAPTSPAAVNAGCDSACTTSCTGPGGDVGIRWDGTPTDASAWDELAGTVVLGLANKLRQCEAARGSCAACLDNLRAKGVIQ